MDEQIESWQNKIRDLAPLMQKAEYELLKSQADEKRVIALCKAVALSKPGLIPPIISCNLLPPAAFPATKSGPAVNKRVCSKRII